MFPHRPPTPASPISVSFPFGAICSKFVDFAKKIFGLHMVTKEVRLVEFTQCWE